MISDYKHMQASQVERDAALAIYEKASQIKCIVHYDTTTRSSIDGEWPSLIFVLSDGRDYFLQQ